MKKNKAALVILLLTVTSVLVAGCSGTKDSISEKITENTAEETESIDGNLASEDDSDSGVAETVTITVATLGTGPAPFVYTDEDGNVTGYDIDLLKAIFDRIDGYELEIVTTEFESIFSGIDAGYYQIGANQLSYSAERSEKYAMSYVYDVVSTGLLVKEDSDITSIYDLGGHTIETYPTDPYLPAYEAYNEENPDNPIGLTFVDSTAQSIIHLEDGSIDSVMQSVVTLQEYIEEYGYTDLKIVTIPLDDFTDYFEKINGSFYLFSKDNQELVDLVNETFKELFEEGVVYELRTEYFGDAAINDEYTWDYIEQTQENIENELSGN